MTFPRLFGSTPQSMETYNNSLGMGTLIDATSCKVTAELDGMYELQITYPMIGEHFADLQAGNVIVAKPYRDAPGVQPFTIYKESRPMSGQVTFYAQHIGYKALGVPIRPINAQSAQEAVSAITAAAVIDQPFTLSTDVDSATPFLTNKPAALQSILLGTSGSLVTTYGADVSRDGYTIQLLQHLGTDRGARIVYGRNLMDLTQDKNISNVYDAVYPFYSKVQDDGTVQLVEIDSTLILLTAASNVAAQNVYILDLSSNFDEPPTPADLLAEAQDYVDKNRSSLTVPELNLSLKYVDLSRTQEYADMQKLDHIELGDTVTVQYPELGVNVTARATKLVYDVLLGAYESIGVGEVKPTVADTIAQSQAASTGSGQQIQVLTIKTNQATQAAGNAAKTATDYITDARGQVVFGKAGLAAAVSMGANGLTFTGVKNQTVLWQNSNPSRMAAGTRINIDLSEYNVITIGWIDNLGGIYTNKVTGATVQYQPATINGLEQRGFYVWDSVRIRTFTPDAAGITFGAGGWLTSTQQNGIPVGDPLHENAACCIPFVIYGFM